MRSYGQYCPMAMAIEVLGERWTLLIIRDLVGGGRRFNDLARGLPGISRTLLTNRLRQLEREGVIERQVGDGEAGGAYQLTRAGRELQPVINALVGWGARWAFGEPQADQLDPVLLLWWMRDGVRRDHLLPRQVVVQFDFRGASTDTLWMRLEPADVSVCLTPPGSEIDILVRADLAALYRVWVGSLSLARAQRTEAVRLEGPRALIRAFPQWWAWSPVAPAVRAAARSRPAHPTPVAEIEGRYTHPSTAGAEHGSAK